jgi:archaellum component FlaC
MGRGDDDPLVAEIRERLARVEARLDGVDSVLADIKDRIKSLDNRLWAVLVTVVLTIILTIWKLLVV